MRFACMNSVAPGVTLMEQCDAIARAGCQGLETIVFPETNLSAWQRDVHAACRATGLELVSVVLGGLALHQRDQMAYVRAAMQAITALNAAVLMTPEYAAQEPLPLFPPHPAPPADEQERVDAALAAISEAAAVLHARVLIEPITQFESRFCRDVATATTLCKRLNNACVQLVLDTHNMNITEASIGKSIRHAGAHIGHMHLSDSNRCLPGFGHIDFVEVFVALREVGYDGWFSFECTVPGDFAGTLQSTLAQLRAVRNRLS